MHRKLALILLFTILIPLLSSCYDANEIDDYAFVSTIGIDKGISNKWRISYQIPLIKSGGSDQSSESKGTDFTVITVDAPSFFAAINLVNTSVPRKLNFMHTKYIVFSEEAAREGLIATFAAPLTRYREIRRTMRVLVTRGSARDFIKEFKPSMGATITKTQEGLLRESDDTGFFPDTTLKDVYDNIKSSYGQPIAMLASINNFDSFQAEGEKFPSEKPPGPANYKAGEIPRQGGSKIELMGAALLKGDKMVASLDGYDTRILLMARGQFQRGVFTLNDPLVPTHAVPLSIAEARKPQVKISFNNGKPVINLKIQLEGDIMAISSRVNYEKPELKKLLEDSVEKMVKQQLDKLVNKCKELDIDVFRFGNYAVRHFATIQQWEEYNWLKHFQDAEVVTQVKFNVRRTGSMITSSPIVSPEEENK